MGLLDGLFGFIGQQGAQTTQNVTASQPTTQSGSNYTGTPTGSYLPGSPAPQPATIDAVSWVQSGISGIGTTVTSGIQYGQTIIAGGIQAIQPVTQPIVSTISRGVSYINPASAPLMVVSAPLAAPLAIGAAGAGFVSSLIPREPTVISAPSPAIQNQTQQIPQNMTIFVPQGNRAQVEVNNISTFLYDPVGGGFEAMVVPAGHSITNIVASGSSGSLQSGMFSIKPLTPVVYTQESAGTKLAPSAMPAEAAKVLAAPESFSRLGAEAYGGYVAPLDGRTLTPDTPVSVYPAGSGNLAALVNPVGINQDKRNFAVLPWNVSPSMTGIYAVDTKGKFTALDAKGYTMIGMTPPGGRLVGGGMVAGDITITDRGLPAPFISTISQENQWVYRNDPLAVIMEGALYAGDSLTFGLWTPGKDLLAQKGQSTPDHEYGAFSEWSRGVGSGIQRLTGVETPLTPEDFTKIERSPSFESLPTQTQWGMGMYKVLATDPASLGRSALQGVEIYATMGLAELGFGAMAARATPGIVQTVGKGGMKAMASPYVQGAVGAGFAGYGVWESTQGFSLPRGQAVSNLGGMTIHVAAMTGGALAAGKIAQLSEIRLNYGTSTKTIQYSNDAAAMSFGGIKPKEPTTLPAEPIKKPVAGYSVEQMRMAYAMKGTTVPVPRAYLQPEPTAFMYGKGGVQAGGTVPKGYPNIDTFVPATPVSKMVSSRTPAFNIYGIEKTYGVANSETLAAYGRGKLSPVNLGTGGTIFKLPAEKAGAPVKLTRTGRFWMDVEEKPAGTSVGFGGGVVGNVGSRGGVVTDISSGKMVLKSYQQEQSFAVSSGIFETGKDYTKLMSYEHLAPDYAKRTRIFEDEAVEYYRWEIPGVKRPEPPVKLQPRVLPIYIQEQEMQNVPERLIGISPASSADVLRNNWRASISRSDIAQERITEKISGVGLATISGVIVGQLPLSLQVPVTVPVQTPRSIQRPVMNQILRETPRTWPDVAPDITPAITPVITPVVTPVVTPVTTPVTTVLIPPEIVPEIVVPPVIPPFWIPGGGSESGYGYRGSESWTKVNPVGADLMAKTRGSLPNFKKMKAIKFKPMKLPKF